MYEDVVVKDKKHLVAGGKGLGVYYFWRYIFARHVETHACKMGRCQAQPASYLMSDMHQQQTYERISINKRVTWYALPRWSITLSGLPLPFLRKMLVIFHPNCCVQIINCHTNWRMLLWVRWIDECGLLIYLGLPKLACVCCLEKQSCVCFLYRLYIVVQS